MLRICTEQEFEKYIDFVYHLALDQSKSGYPTYSDGIKTREMFIQRSQKAFSRNTEEILLFESDGVVEGWIHYYWLPDDNYLSTVSFIICSHTEQALQEFLEFARERFKGYDLFLGYSTENRQAVHFLSAHGFECIENDYNNTAFLDRYEPIAVSDRVIRVTKENYESFRRLHDNVEGDMYWNSDRIYADLDNWIIFVMLQDGEPVGSVYYLTDDDGWFEIFGIDRKDGVFRAEIFRELLGKALNTAKELGGKYMTFFCEDEEQEIVGTLGFECVGQYVCYQLQLT
ncbi:MAG: hypothetical protein IJ468_06910 [Lachnospiraceae bacterium]|nr:hypothetical protein [Lachnospiraceae bacterium]